MDPYATDEQMWNGYAKAQTDFKTGVSPVRGLANFGLSAFCVCVFFS